MSMIQDLGEILVSVGQMKERNESQAQRIADLEAHLQSANTERSKLMGFYNEIVAAIGHDRILREYDQRGELLRDEAHRRKDAEVDLAAMTASRDELMGVLEEIATTSWTDTQDGETDDLKCYHQWVKAQARDALARGTGGKSP